MRPTTTTMTSTTTTTTSTTTTHDAELQQIERDLAITGRSLAADRRIAAAWAALDARKAAHGEAQRVAREDKKLAVATRRQERREAEARARARYWSARRPVAQPA